MFQRAVVPMLVALFLLVGTTSTRAADDQEARNFIQDVAQKAITTVADQNISDSERNQRFREVFVSAFDIPEIGKFVLSRHWQSANPAQQAEFLKAFEDTQVLTWSQRFKHYNGVRLETQGVSKDGDGLWLVDLQYIIRPQGPPTPVQWRIERVADGSMHIVDIKAEGVSMALTHRDYHARSSSRTGEASRRC